MPKLIEIHLPRYPECWTSCGNCGSGEVSVDDVLVAPGDLVARDDTLLILETGKVALDIPAPQAWRIVDVFVAPGDMVAERHLIMTLDIEASE